MLNRFCSSILVLLTQLASCVSHQFQTMDPVPVASTAEVRHVAMVGGEQFVLVTGKPESWRPRSLVRLGGDAAERSVLLQTKETRCVGEALVARDARWWYSRCTGDGVQFVSSDAFDSPAFVSVPGGADPREWLPLDRDEPGGVLISVEDDERTSVATLVTRSGSQKTIGRFDRGSSVWGAEPGRAVLLGDDGVAVITIEADSSEPAQSSIVLRVMRDGDVARSRVAFHERGWASVDAAIDPAGDLAIVAAPFDGSGVVAVLLDPRHPEEAIVRHLTGSAVAVPYPGLRLTVHGARFVASWIREEDRAVQIAEFDRRTALPAVTIAARSGGPVPAISLGRSPGNGAPELTVFWTGDEGGVMMRRLPPPPTGALLARELSEAFAKWAAHRADRVRSRE
jgi:hypothetical protein